MSNKVALEVQNLCFKSRKKNIYKNINFEVYEGEVVGLLGHNGVGKSTMQRVMANQETSHSGKVLVAGCENDINVKDRNIILIPDDIELFKNMNIRDNLELLAQIYGYDEEFYRKYLKVVKLDEKMIIKELSKGNQEIIQLIIYMSLNTKVLLLDEPFSAVDIFRRELIQQMIMDIITKNEERSLLITTHLLLEIQNILTRVIYLNRGEVVINKEMEEIEMEAGDLVSYLKEYFGKDVGYEID